MKGLIEKAYAGNRQAVMELYEKYYKGAAAICGAGYENSEMANAAVVQAFENTWGYLLNKSIKSEEEFEITLYKQAAILCRKNYTKKGAKGLPIPQNKNFLIGKLQTEKEAEKSVLENVLTMLPGINRYVFVLHRIAGFEEKMIASITGYKMAVVDAALAAEEQNIVRILEQLNEDAKTTINLENEIQQYQEKVDLPEEYQKQILARIDALVKPYEKKKMIRGSLYAAGAIGLAAVVCIIGASIGKKDNEITFTTTDPTAGSVTESAVGTSDEAADAGESEDSSSEAAGIEFAEGQLYYADIVIEDYGTITVQLDHETAPITVENFISLAEEDFYDGLTFHRIMEGFMMQGGDPNGNGSGGSDKNIVGEFSDNGYENDLSHTRGVISMARSSAYDSASSQFFIVHEDSTFLDGQYAAFGYVTEGMDIVDAICTEAEPTDNNGTISAEEQPVITSIDIRIESEE